MPIVKRQTSPEAAYAPIDSSGGVTGPHENGAFSRLATFPMSSLGGSRPPRRRRTINHLRCASEAGRWHLPVYPPNDQREVVKEVWTTPVHPQ